MSKRTSTVFTIIVILLWCFVSVAGAQTQGDQVCEVCGMTVSPEAQTRYLATDGTGTVHYVECFMCALNLVKDYSQVHVATSCDWYGPSYTITVDSKNFGQEVTVDPPTAMFLNGGSCVINRAAYDQTAADELLANGYSQFTLSDQRYPLPSNTKEMTVLSAVLSYGQSSPKQPDQSMGVQVIAIVIGVAIIFGSVFAFWKLKGPKNSEKDEEKI